MKTANPRRNLNIVVVSTSDQNIQVIGNALKHLPGVEIGIERCSVSQANAAVLSKNAPDVLMLDVEVNDAGELEALRHLVRRMPLRTMVVVTSRDAEIKDIRSLMRFGVADYIPQPISRSELRSTLEEAIQRSLAGNSNSRPTGQIYTVVGAGGGAGVTTLAIQLADELMHGNSTEKRQVCLLDFDIQFGNAGFSLDLDTGRGMFELLQDHSKLDPVHLRSVMAQHKSGLDVLTGSQTVLPLDAVTPEAAEHILAIARNEYDHVVVDLPRACTDWSLSVLGASDIIFLVTNDKVASLDRARRTLRMLAEQNLGAVPLMVVANGLDSGWGTRQKLKQAEAVLGRKIDFCVRNDAKTLNSALDRGVFLRDVKKRSPIEQDVRKLIGYATRKLHGELAAVDGADHAMAAS
jgi:pilus assembly protein CpaE